MFKELNPLLHSELRLAVMSLLIGVEEADFVFIRQQTGATAGNLSVQIDKLNKAKEELNKIHENTNAFKSCNNIYKHEET